jgi:PAS domain S-box-containing protein
MPLSEADVSKADLDVTLESRPVTHEAWVSRSTDNLPPQYSGAELFELLVASARDYAIFVLDPGGHIITWNPGAQRIKQYHADEIIGKHFSTFYPLEDIRRGKPEEELRIARAEGRVEDEGWRIRKDGSLFWASVVITALYATNGELVGFAKITRDLTERMEGERERLQILEMEREARYQAEQTLEQLRAVQQVTEAALGHIDVTDLLPELMDQVANILRVDTVAILRLDEGEHETEPCLITWAIKGFDEPIPEGERIPLGKGFVGKIAKENKSRILQDVSDADVISGLIRRRNLRSMLGVPLTVGGRVIGVLHVGSLRTRRFTERDSSFLKIVGDSVAMAIDHARVIEQARIARAEHQIAEATIQARDEFLSIASHELKTPITSIRIATQMLLRQFEAGREPGQHMQIRALQAVDNQSIKLTRLITQLLDRVRMQSPSVGSLERTTVNVPELLKGVTDRAVSMAPNQTLAYEGPDELEAQIDPLRFEQVVTNLVDNSIKFSPQGGVTRLILESTDESGGFRLTVKDQGMGVDQARRGRLFERYYQAHGEGYRSGMGLGLYISREIVTMHGGTISAAFPSTGGTEITVEMPAA